MKATVTVFILSALCLAGLFCEGTSSSPFEDAKEWVYPDEMLQQARALLMARSQGSSPRLYTVTRDSGPLAFLKRGVMMGVDLPDFIMSSQQGQGGSGTKNIQNLKQRLFQSGRRR